MRCQRRRGQRVSNGRRRRRVRRTIGLGRWQRRDDELRGEREVRTSRGRRQWRCVGQVVVVEHVGGDEVAADYTRQGYTLEHDRLKWRGTFD